jgi:GT2 family glycosyltransferase
MTRVTFVLPVRNDARRLARCLDSIARSRAPAVCTRVVVADNGSTDGSGAVADERGAVVLALPGLRVAELRNNAAAEGPADHLAFVDSDHEIADGWLAAMAEVMSDDTIGAVGALCDPPPNGTWVQETYGWLRGKTRGHKDVNWLGSGNMAVRRVAFDQVGGFDVTLEACEDVDLCQRLRAAGWRVVADERLVNVHYGDPATLAALFRSEWWRGQNNLRVSLRGPLKASDIPSIVIPFATVTLLVGIAAGGALASLGEVSRWYPVAATLGVLGLALARATLTLRRGGRWTPVAFGRACLVALVYDLARAVALVAPAPHHRSAKRLRPADLASSR